MPIKASSNSTPRSLIPADNYPARVVQIVDLGLQPQRPYQGQEKPPVNKVMVGYELVNEFLEDENGNPDPEKPRWINEELALYPLSSDRAKSTLRMKVFDPDNQLGGDFSQTLQTACIVQVVHNVSTANGNTYANVGGVNGPMKGMPVPEGSGKTILFELDDPDMEVFNSFPDWLQEKIKGNLEFSGSPLAVALGMSETDAAPDPSTAGEEIENPFDS